MKLRSILIFPNGSLSFCDKKFSFNTINQYLLVKKTDSSFFFSENKTIQSPIYKNLLKNHNKYFK
jgi:hypothetical protein